MEFKTKKKKVADKIIELMMDEKEKESKELIKKTMEKPVQELAEFFLYLGYRIKELEKEDATFGESYY